MEKGASHTGWYQSYSRNCVTDTSTAQYDEEERSEVHPLLLPELWRLRSRLTVVGGKGRFGILCQLGVDR